MSSIVRFSLTMILAAALLAGCSSSQGAQVGPANALPAVQAVRPGVQPATSAYQTLYRFHPAEHKGVPGGDSPNGALIDVDGTMYGTTQYGGAGCGHLRGCGTVYSMSAAGVKKIIYTFKGGTSDGAYPVAGLLDVHGTLYGTTTEGGSTCNNGDGCGTVFSLTLGGRETILYRFAGPPNDGSRPNSPLVEINGTLYGTTLYGGGSCTEGNYDGCGTVFSISPSGSESVLHSFTNGQDGGLPVGLIAVKGRLYGTTFKGGGSGCKNGMQCGVLYRLDTNGTKTTLHLFTSPKKSFGSGGNEPNAPLIYANGLLYGTTAYGGKVGGFCWLFGCGVVFSATLNGTTKVVHTFAGGASDGALPNQLTYVNGTLYGTTQGCGLVDCSTDGIAYSLTSSGQETLMHTFTGVPDGAQPAAQLLDLNGTLYGTTVYGGETGCGSSFGCGTVFSLTP